MEKKPEEKLAMHESPEKLPGDPEKEPRGDLFSEIKSVEIEIGDNQREFGEETMTEMTRIESKSGLAPKELDKLKKEAGINDALRENRAKSSEAGEKAQERLRRVKKIFRNFMVLCSALSTFYGGDMNMSKAYGAEIEKASITTLKDIDSIANKLKEGENTNPEDQKINEFLEDLRKLQKKRKEKEGDFRLWGEKDPELAKKIEEIKEYLEKQLNIKPEIVNIFYMQFNQMMNEEAREANNPKWKLEVDSVDAKPSLDGEGVFRSGRAGDAGKKDDSIGVYYRKKF